MSTSAILSTDEFQALEQKVLRAVDVLRHERDARAAAEIEVARLREQLRTEAEATHTAQAELSALQQEREHVRQRVEKMLQQMDELL